MLYIRQNKAGDIVQSLWIYKTVAHYAAGDIRNIIGAAANDQPETVETAAAMADIIRSLKDYKSRNYQEAYRPKRNRKEEKEAGRGSYAIGVMIQPKQKRRGRRRNYGAMETWTTEETKK